MRALICILALVWGSAAVAQANDAVLIDDDARLEWQAIGRVNVGGYRSRSLCTGTLIAPDVVLTAAHCVVDPATQKPFRAGRVIFVAGWHKGTHQGASEAKSITVSPAFLEAYSKDAASRAAIKLDWATIQLASPLDGVSPLSVAKSPAQKARSGPVAILGYRFDRPQALSRYLDCDANPVSGRPLQLTCPVVAGTSGAPVLQRDADGIWRIVAVVSATRTGGGLAAELLPDFN